MEDLEEQRVIENLKQITLKNVTYCNVEAWQVNNYSGMPYKYSTEIVAERHAPEHSNNQNKAVDDKSLMFLAQWLPVSETFAEKDISELLNAD